jgi:anti-sigma B factor antagonist
MSPPQSSFRYEVEHSEVREPEDRDSRGSRVTTFKCHGRLVIETRDQLAEMFRERLFHGHIMIDLSGVSHIDSAGLGALVRLKMSAAKQPGVSLKFVEMSPRVVQLLKVANLTDWFTS